MMNLTIYTLTYILYIFIIILIMKNKTSIIIILIISFIISISSQNDTKNGVKVNSTDLSNSEKSLTQEQTKSKSLTQDPKEIMKEMMQRNIIVWTPIILFAIAAFAVYIISTMEIPKNTLLYATYVTSKSDKIN